MRELDVTIAYDLTDNLNIFGAFANGNGESGYNKLSFGTGYSF